MLGPLAGVGDTAEGLQWDNNGGADYRFTVIP